MGGVESAAPLHGKGDGALLVEVCCRVVVIEDLEGFVEFGVATELLDWLARGGSPW